MDIQRVLLNLHRRQLPMAVLDLRADQYVAEELITRENADCILSLIRQERGEIVVANDHADDGDEDEALAARGHRRLSASEMQELLEKRAHLMKMAGADDAPTDQFRVYTHIIQQLVGGTSPLRLMVQASAGTGKSFLLTTVYLWCIINGRTCSACAPTAAPLYEFRWSKRMRVASVHD